MIIWGSKGKTKTLNEGEFFCPKCRARRKYEHKEIGRYFTLYFIPLFKTKSLMEFVECQTCFQAYELSILETEKELEKQHAGVDQIQEMVSSIQDTLNKGIPVQLIMDQLRNYDLDETAAINLVAMAAGGPPKKCPSCGMFFKRTLHYCSSCGTPLQQ